MLLLLGSTAANSNTEGTFVLPHIRKKNDFCPRNRDEIGTAPTTEGTSVPRHPNYRRATALQIQKGNPYPKNQEEIFTLDTGGQSLPQIQRDNLYPKYRGEINTAKAEAIAMHLASLHPVCSRVNGLGLHELVAYSNELHPRSQPPPPFLVRT